MAIVNDQDGYVNVRSSAEISRNNILDTLPNGNFVYVLENELTDGNWTMVDFKSIYNGYIYKDRLRYVSDYQNIQQVFANNAQIIFQNSDICIEIKIRKFNKSKHKFTYTIIDGYEFLSEIDGKEYWGTDDRIPEYEYEYICISQNSEKYFLPQEAVAGLYEPNINIPADGGYITYMSINYDKENDILYIQSMNGDGAGGYIVAWKIEKGVYKERAVFHGF